MLDILQSVIVCITGLSYHTYAEDEIAIFTTAPAHVAEITQNQKGYYSSFLTTSYLKLFNCTSGLLAICKS